MLGQGDEFEDDGAQNFLFPSSLLSVFTSDIWGDLPNAEVLLFKLVPHCLSRIFHSVLSLFVEAVMRIFLWKTYLL